jgi:hypothetical protein
MRAQRCCAPGRRGHQVSVVLASGGGYQAILLDQRTGNLHDGSGARPGISDSRACNVECPL